MRERREQARPEYVGEVDLSKYQTVYFGYPIWWGDLPMVVITLLKNMIGTARRWYRLILMKDLGMLEPIRF